MKRMTGTISRGVRAPVFRAGDDVAKIVVDSVLACSQAENAPIRDRDIVAVTEAVVARAQSNYAGIGQIAKEVAAKFPSGEIALVFPILSRNRFATCLRGIAAGLRKIHLVLAFPSDEVGNHLFDPAKLIDTDIDPWRDTLDEATYRAAFGYDLHPFTGIDYVAYYLDLIRDGGCEADVHFTNRVERALDFAPDVLVCDIHTRAKSKRALQKAGARTVFGLEDLLTAPVDGSGYNAEYGLLGSNKATEDTVKLFPRDPQPIVDAIQAGLLAATGRHVEVMVYGDGAFKDPVGKIWELADPVVSPAFTAGLNGTTNELKLKYLADNQFANLSGEALAKAIRERIQEKGADLKGSMESQGTTPRRLTDLIGSLCDLTSGSGDKGTPIVWIQGYFDTYAAE
ncbi:MAG: coenzyme F420-0:L-glutamate ligase [Kiritimatiellia bacterium]|jgi:F420-0:gamma-glutamyl ligase